MCGKLESVTPAGGDFTCHVCVHTNNKKHIGYFVKKMRSATDPPVSPPTCPSTSISCSSIVWEGVPPASHLCNAWYSRTVHLYSEFASSFDVRPVLIQEPGSACPHTSLWDSELLEPHGSDWRLFGRLSGHPSDHLSRFLNSKKTKNRWLGENKKTWVLLTFDELIWVLVWQKYSTPSGNSWQKNKVLNSTHSIHVRSCFRRGTFG